MFVAVNRSSTVFQTGLFQLMTDNITLPSGETTDVHVLRHPGAAAIVPISDKNRVVLIRQYRHAFADVIWEIPAGTRTSDEEPLSCARRELREETGYSAQAWESLGMMTPVPGYSDERIHLFLATDLTAGHQNLDRDELLEVCEIDWNKAMEMVYNGIIQDGKTIAGLLLADARLRMQAEWKSTKPIRPSANK